LSQVVTRSDRLPDDIVARLQAFLTDLHTEKFAPRAALFEKGLDWYGYAQRLARIIEQAGNDWDCEHFGSVRCA
jgi:hypothetical protein